MPLINAVKLSKYSKYIHLILAGEGVEQDKYEAELNKMHLQYTMNHYPENDLREILSYTDIFTLVNFLLPSLPISISIT